MKRVLVLAYDFPPQGGTGVIRVTKLVKYLPAHGWSPVVVCADAASSPDPGLLAELPADLEVHRVPWPGWLRPLWSVPSAADASGPPGRVGGRRPRLRWARRLLVPEPAILWLPGAERAAARVLGGAPVDALLSTSPPNAIHLAARLLAARFELPWVADFRDPWTAAGAVVAGPGFLGRTFQRRLERGVLAAADRTMTISEPLAAATEAAFGDVLRRPVAVITNGFDPDDFAAPPPPLDPGFTLTYVGTVLGTRTDNAFPEGLRLALARSAAFRSRACVRFVGALAPEYRARLAGLEANVEVLPFVTHDEALRLMRGARALLLLLPREPVAAMTFTGKFFEYLAARRPMLAVAPPGVVADLVRDEGIGRAAPPGDPEAIAAALLELFAAVEADPTGTAPSEAILARFDRRRLAGRMAAILDEVA